MENDGPETVDPRKTPECLPQLHDWTPIIEGAETVGVVCSVYCVWQTSSGGYAPFIANSYNQWFRKKNR
jgi:hypothetical protein